jgi:hypothetical protein
MIVAMALAASALGGCSDKEQANEQNIAIDEGIPSGIPANADIETLPADESSVTPSNQLQNGIDAPETNETATNAM